jgi:hypothetical protein
VTATVRFSLAELLSVAAVFTKWNAAVAMFPCTAALVLLLMSHSQAKSRCQGRIVRALASKARRTRKEGKKNSRYHSLHVLDGQPWQHDLHPNLVPAL